MIECVKLLNGLRYHASQPLSACRVRSVANDSRCVTRGDLFIAYNGFAADGRKFIPEAIMRGARAIIAEKDFAAPPDVIKIIVKDTRSALPIIADNLYGHPSRAVRLVGITGTNGKTTITYLIEGIFAATRIRTGVIGTINYRFAGKSIPATNTTPGPLELHGLLARMRDRRIAAAVMEVSSHSLDQGRVAGISFDTAVFTNITPEHLDYHRTVRRYLAAKAKIFSYLKPHGVAILNADDARVARLGRTLGAKVLTYGIDANADITARDLELSLTGSRFTAVTPRGNIAITTSLVGRHNVSNILAAIAVAYTHRIPSAAIQRGIRAVKGVPGRLERIRCGQPFQVFVDFAHTEDALRKILELVRDVDRSGRIITVFGCGGNRDRAKRPAMGKTACRLSDQVFITSDNPRFEDPCAIIREIENGVRSSYSNYTIIEDRRAAIKQSLHSAMAGDIVIIAGKGHEKYQIIKDKVLPFDDCLVAAACLRRRS